MAPEQTTAKGRAVPYPPRVPPRMAQRSRQELLSAPLGELEGLWLSLGCGCGRTVAAPFRLLAQGRRGVRLVDILPRLRCEQCKGRPARASVKSFPAAGAQYPDTWEVALIP